MKVRIKSGSQAGAIVEMSTIEAQSNIGTGFAEAIIDEPEPSPKATEAEPEAEPEAAVEEPVPEAVIDEPAPRRRRSHQPD